MFVSYERCKLREEDDTRSTRITTDSCESGLLGSYDGDLWDLGGVTGRDGAKMVEDKIALGSVNSSRRGVLLVSRLLRPLTPPLWVVPGSSCRSFCLFSRRVLP